MKVLSVFRKSASKDAPRKKRGQIVQLNAKVRPAKNKGLRKVN